MTATTMARWLIPPQLQHLAHIRLVAAPGGLTLIIPPPPGTFFLAGHAALSTAVVPAIAAPKVIANMGGSGAFVQQSSPVFSSQPDGGEALEHVYEIEAAVLIGGSIICAADAGAKARMMTYALNVGERLRRTFDTTEGHRDGSNFIRIETDFVGDLRGNPSELELINLV